MLNPQRKRLETVRRRAHGLEGVTPGAGTASAAADGAPVQGVAPVGDFDGPSRGDVHAPSGPDAVVLSCLGGSQGDLGVVRALGRCGVACDRQIWALKVGGRTGRMAIGVALDTDEVSGAGWCSKGLRGFGLPTGAGV